MSNLKFTYLNPKYSTLVSKTPFNSTTRYTTPSICYSKNGTVSYIPLIKPNGNITIGDKSYYYDSSDNITNKTIHCYYNNEEYVVPNKSSDLDDIPIGTYSPSNFKTLIESFISSNGSRTCKNAFAVTVYDVWGGTYPSGHRITVPANSVIKRVTQYSNKRQGVSFNGGDMSDLHWNNSTISGGYIYYDTYNGDPFKKWASSNIFVSGIKFN